MAERLKDSGPPDSRERLLQFQVRRLRGDGTSLYGRKRQRHIADIVPLGSRNGPVLVTRTFRAVLGVRSSGVFFSRPISYDRVSCLVLRPAARTHFAVMERPLEPERVERRVTAILAADVVGYSRLIGKDDEGTLARLKAHHDALIGPKIGEYRGRIVRTTGDGLLVLFASVVEALHCAIEVQRGMVERNEKVPSEARIEFRIGINFGDIIIDDGSSIHGDGVNVAARLEALAEPGGICVSGRVQEDAQGRFDITFEDAGEQQLKNIARPIRVYRVGLKAKTAPPLLDEQPVAAGPIQGASGGPPSQHVQGRVKGRVSPPLARRSGALQLFFTYAVVPILALLLAHYLIVMKLDLDTAYLRVFSLVLPAIVGYTLFWQAGRDLGAALLLGATTGIVSVFGMLAIVGLVDSTTVVPSSRFEWQEAIEYAVGITLATVIGSALAHAIGAVRSDIRGH
jgi:class 3 adenylate cyclase